MFEAADSLSARELNDVAYYTLLALERRFTPEDLRRTPILAGLSSEPGPEAQDLSCRWLEEIQQAEGRPIDQLDGATIERYRGQLSSMASLRYQAENRYDPAESQRLLEELRKAVPLPSMLQKAG